MKLKKRITLDDLAAMLKRQFDHIDKRFDDVKEGMATKEDVGKIEIRLGNLERRFDKIDEIVLEDHRPRIRALEKELGIN